MYAFSPPYQSSLGSASSKSKCQSIFARINRISAYAKLPSHQKPHQNVDSEHSLLAYAAPRPHHERLQDRSLVVRKFWRRVGEPALRDEVIGPREVLLVAVRGVVAYRDVHLANVRLESNV
jgi:hypothetical protein